MKNEGVHTHPPNAGLVQEKLSLYAAKQDAIRQPFKSMNRLFSDAFHGQQDNEEMVDPIPSFKKHKHALYRSRLQRLPPIPHNRAEIVLTIS